MKEVGSEGYLVVEGVSEGVREVGSKCVRDFGGSPCGRVSE